MWMWCVRAALWPTADEEGVPRRHIIAEGWAPEIVVALRLQNWRDLGAGGSQAADFHQHIDDGLGHEAGNGRAAKMLDAADESGGKTSP